MAVEKTWDEITAEVEAMHQHQDFSERLIFGLIAFAVLASLAGAPKIWSLLWVLPTAGYLLGRHAVETLYHPFRDYWLASLGSQAALAFIVGVPLLIRFGI